MTTLKMYQVDAFAKARFSGNPAAVVPLDAWLPEPVMQNIASENNLSETAFFVPTDTGYRIRWFTPTHEAPLCGHATLATAYVIFTHLNPTLDMVQFESMSGNLGVSRRDDLLVLDFPRMPTQGCDEPTAMLAGLGLPPQHVFKATDDPNYYAVYETEAEILVLKPDLAQLAQLDPYGTVVTAPGETSDFVSRYFAPGAGIPEDPVTGSIHCALVPYWAAQLGKQKFFARQLSQRGGELYCELLGDRVSIAGHAVQYLAGVIEI